MVKLDEIVGKRTIKEMLDEPAKVLDVVIPDVKEEKAIEKVVENYEPKSIDVLKETGKDMITAAKVIGAIGAGIFKTGAYFVAGAVGINLIPYLLPYIMSDRKDTLFKKVGNNLPWNESFIDKDNIPRGLGVCVGGVVGGFAAAFVYPGSIVYALLNSEKVPNEAYWLFPTTIITTNVFSYLYERIQVNRIKLKSKSNTLEGVVKDE